MVCTFHVPKTATDSSGRNRIGFIGDASPTNTSRSRFGQITRIIQIECTQVNAQLKRRFSKSALSGINRDLSARIDWLIGGFDDR